MRGIGPDMRIERASAGDDDNESGEFLALGNDCISPLVLVERRTLIRDCLSRCISADFGAPVISFPTVERLHEASVGLKPALIIISEWEGVESRIDGAIDLLGRAGLKAPIVVLSDAEHIDNVVDTLRSGASGHVPTGVALKVAIEAMRHILVGGVFVPSDSLLAFQQQQKVESKAEPKVAFTARQNEVLEALCLGKTNKVIAYELNMSESTVKVHVRSIMKKLQAKNRTEVAVRVAKFLNENQPARWSAESERRSRAPHLCG